jgi:hypothetical protein
LKFSAACPANYMEICESLKDVKSMIDERGDFVKVIIREEGDVERDSYKSIKKRSFSQELNMKAYPIDIRPSQKQLEKAGIREQCEITIWTATADWNRQGLDFNAIEMGGRSTVVWQGNVYDIRDKNQVNQIIDSFGYITLGLVKR